MRHDLQSALRWPAACGAVVAALLSQPATAQQAQTQLQRLPLAGPQPSSALQIVDPDELRTEAPAGSVTLEARSNAEMMRSLEVTRRFDKAALLARPDIALGPDKVDMRPVFENPAALTNVAARLRAAPALVSGVQEQFEVVEVDQGLIVRQYLAYTVNPGVCSRAGSARQLARAGVECFERQSPARRAAAFADPDDPHYVADPAERRRAIDTAAKAEALQAAEIAADLATFRAMLRDPVQRAAIEAEVGAAEAARLERLGDSALEGEMLNTGEVEIEETMFVPGGAKPAMTLAPDIGPIRSLGQAGDASGPASGLHVLNLPPLVRRVETTHEIEDRIYLTGFTLGRDHEWSKKAKVTIAWCLLGCKKTYYAKVYAGFDYGFGLRFPVQLGGTYRYERRGDSESASFTPSFTTVNGSAADFTAAGLPSSQLFDGKEMVAQIGAHAGFAYKVPIFGQDDIGFGIGVDLTDEFPQPFRGGQFTPPMPGNPTPPVIKTFENVDLIAGRANFGVVGAKLLPAINLMLVSSKLQFRLTDKVSGKISTITRSGQALPLAVDAASHASRFTVGDPVYNLAFSLTPGVDARVFVDVKAWSHKWDWYAWFPQLTVTLPPGGQDFSCHRNTICNREYELAPNVANESEGQTANPTDRVVDAWKPRFTAMWQGQCPDEPLRLCRTAIAALASTYANRMVPEMKAAGTPQEAGIVFRRLEREANDEASDVIREANRRAARR